MEKIYRKRDCHDGSDESDEICKSKGKCASNEIKCADGNGCIPKVRFCDKFVDCKDSRLVCKCLSRPIAIAIWIPLRKILSSPTAMNQANAHVEHI